MLRLSRTLSLASLPVLFLLGLGVACSDDSGGTGGAGGSSTDATTTSSSTKSSTTATSSTTSASTTTASTTTASTTTTGGPMWPDCSAQPPGSPEKTLPEIWADDPVAPAEAWVPGVYVTAVSGGACVAQQSCQLFIQQEESYTTLAEATHQSLRVAVAPSVAEHFQGIAVGDRIDFYGHAFRDTQDGKNELFFLVADSLPGCAAVVGAGDPQPITVTLDDLTTPGYETEYGPVLVRVDTVSGNPNLPTETFALWDTGTMPNGDITTVTSLSPYFLPGATFTGLMDGVNTDFSEVIGVFAIFAPPADPLIKYEEIYVRSDAEYPTL